MVIEMVFRARMLYPPTLYLLAALPEKTHTLAVPV
jgi:hypothetical protein